MKYLFTTTIFTIMGIAGFEQSLKVYGNSDTLIVRGTSSTDNVMFWMKGGLQQIIKKDTVSRLINAPIVIKGLQNACFSYALVAFNKGDNLLTKEVAFNSVWVGSHFTRCPEAGVLKGHWITDSINSRFLAEKRGISFYIPPAYSPKKQYPVIFMMDGQALGEYVKAVDYLITAGRIPPLIIVGIYSNEKTLDGLPYRYFEYVKSKRSESQKKIFENHLSYFIEEALPYAQKKYNIDATSKNRILYGNSNAGNFCVYVAGHFPSLFQHIISYSSAGNETGIPNKGTAPDMHLGAGTYEAFPMMLYNKNKQLLDSCTAAGIKTTWADFCGGHDKVIWKEYFLTRIESIFKTKENDTHTN